MCLHLSQSRCFFFTSVTRCCLPHICCFYHHLLPLSPMRFAVSFIFCFNFEVPLESHTNVGNLPDSSISGGNFGAPSYRSSASIASGISREAPPGRHLTAMTSDRSRTRRERTFVGSECAVCEEPLEHTLRGERILQFSCTHVSHEACFYEFIREFESQYCPTCNAPLHLDTSRGGNVLDIGMSECNTCTMNHNEPYILTWTQRKLPTWYGQYLLPTHAPLLLARRRQHGMTRRHARRAGAQTSARPS